MNDENIKEILDGFDKCLKNYELDKAFGQLSVESIYHLFPHKQLLLKDYITNLQQENERLKKYEKGYCFLKENCMMCSADKEIKLELEDYKSRCEKAIEYNYKLQERYCHSAIFDELVASKVYEITEKELNILQNGSDDNE